MASNRSKRQREADLEREAELYLQGKTQVQMAEIIGVSRTAIRHDLKTIRKRWIDAQVRDYDLATVEQLRRIDLAEAKAWQGWENSVRDRSRIVKEGTEGDADSKKGKKRTKIQITTEQTDGDPRWLNIILSCVDRRCKILGLDAPTRQELSGPQGAPLKVESLNVGALTDEELEQLITISRKTAITEGDSGGGEGTE